MLRLGIIGFCAGCIAPAPTAGVTTTGTIGGRWPGLLGAAAQVETGPRGSMLAIVLTTRADACTALAEASLVAGAATVQISLSKSGTGVLFTAATDPGTYTTDGTTAGPWAGILVYDRDASCRPTSYEGVAQGTTTLTAIDPSSDSGSFDFTSPDGERLQGTFVAERCAWTSAVECR